MKYLGSFLIFLSLVYLGLFGIYGLGRNPEYRQVDMSYLYTAGTVWLEGKNPYDVDTFQDVRKSLGFNKEELRYGFAYPPQISSLCIFLARFSFSEAIIIINVLNILALSLLCYCCSEMLGERGDKWILLSILIGNPITAHVFWLGQISLIVSAAIAALWLLKDRQLMGACLFAAIASMKPQLSFFVLLWLFVEKRFNLFVLAASFIFILSLPTLWATDPITTLQTWYSSLFQVKEIAESNPYTKNLIFNLESSFRSIGYEIPYLWIAAFLFLSILFALKKRYSELDILALIALITSLFMYLHDYDLVMLAPVVAACIFYKGDKYFKWFTLVALFSFYVPQRFLRETPVLALGHTREWVLLALFFWLAHLGFYYGLTKSKTK